MSQMGLEGVKRLEDELKGSLMWREVGMGLNDTAGDFFRKLNEAPEQQFRDKEETLDFFR